MEPLYREEVPSSQGFQQVCLSADIPVEDRGALTQAIDGVSVTASRPPMSQNLGHTLGEAVLHLAVRPIHHLDFIHQFKNGVADRLLRSSGNRVPLFKQYILGVDAGKVKEIAMCCSLFRSTSARWQ